MRKGKCTMSSGKRVAQIGSGVVFAILMAAVLAYSLSGTVKGWVAAKFWKGKSTLNCGGNMVMNLDGKKVDLNGTAIIAGGNCHLTLKNCTFKATTPIIAGGNAKVTIEGGTFTGSSDALSVGGSARVTIKGATFKSKKNGIMAGGNAHVEMEAGALTSPDKAVFAGGDAKVILKGTQVEGEILKGGNAVVETN